MSFYQQAIELPESVIRQLESVEPSTSFARSLFVWVKGGRVACLSADEIRGREADMKSAGWHHTATIDPARWIEKMANGPGDPSDMLDEIQSIPNSVTGSGFCQRVGVAFEAGAKVLLNDACVVTTQGIP